MIAQCCSGCILSGWLKGRTLYALLHKCQHSQAPDWCALHVLTLCTLVECVPCLAISDSLGFPRLDLECECLSRKVACCWCGTSIAQMIIWATLLSLGCFHLIGVSAWGLLIFFKSIFGECWLSCVALLVPSPGCMYLSTASRILLASSCWCEGLRNFFLGMSWLAGESVSPKIVSFL